MADKSYSVDVFPVPAMYFRRSRPGWRVMVIENDAGVRTVADWFERRFLWLARREFLRCARDWCWSFPGYTHRSAWKAAVAKSEARDA